MGSRVGRVYHRSGRNGDVLLLGAETPKIPREKLK